VYFKFLFYHSKPFIYVEVGSNNYDYSIRKPNLFYLTLSIQTPLTLMLSYIQSKLSLW